MSNNEFMSMGATKLVDILQKHNSHSSAQVDGALAEVTRRVAKGCKQPNTQAWLQEVLVAYANLDTIPRKKTVVKALAHKPAQESAPIYAEVAEISHREMDAILVMESEDSLATTFTPAA